MREAQNDILSFFKIKKEHNRELLSLYINKVEATGGYASLLLAVQRNRWAVQLYGLLFSRTVLLLTLDVSDDVALLDL